MNYLPSKKFIIIAVSIFVFLGIVFFLINLIEGRKEIFQQKANIKVEKVTLGDIIESDSDNDGLKDWEEALWGTDPNNPDTDGNGITDDVEIKQKRDALQLNADYNPETEKKDLNETELFAREFFTTIVALQQSGSLNEENLKSVFDSLPSFTENFSQQKIYTLSDLIISNDESKQIIIDYTKKIVEILTKYPYPNKEDNAIFILNDFIKNGDTKKLEELNPIIQTYKNIVTDLLNTKTPQSASLIHLNFINSFQNIVEEIGRASCRERV